MRYPEWPHLCESFQSRVDCWQLLLVDWMDESMSHWTIQWRHTWSHSLYWFEIRTLAVPSLSLCFCLNGCRVATLGAKSLQPWSSSIQHFCFWKGTVEPNLFDTWLQFFSARIMILEILCLSILSQHSGRKPAEDLSSSSFLPPPLSYLVSFYLLPSFASHPCHSHHLLGPNVTASLEERAHGCSCPWRSQLIIFSCIISAWAQVDVFLINEAFVLHHKIIEEYPSHFSELCHKVNYEVTLLGLRQERPRCPNLICQLFSKPASRRCLTLRAPDLMHPLLLALQSELSQSPLAILIIRLVEQQD